MKMESGNSLSKLSRNNQKSNLEKQLDFQEFDRPSISEEYYTSAIDFIDHLYTTEHLIGEKFETFPEEFRKHTRIVHPSTIFGNGAIKLAVMRIQHLEKDHKYNIEDDKASDLILELAKDLNEKLGFATVYEYNKDDKHGWVKDSYLACFPGEVVKNEKGEWATKEIDGGAAKFFAFLVTRGLVDEKFVLENNMANLGLKGIKFREDFLKTLSEDRENGWGKIIEEPIHKFE